MLSKKDLFLLINTLAFHVFPFDLVLDELERCNY